MWDIDIQCLFTNNQDHNEQEDYNKHERDSSETEKVSESEDFSAYSTAVMKIQLFRGYVPVTHLEFQESCHNNSTCPESTLQGQGPDVPVNDTADHRSLKILHLTFHDGCRRELDAVARALGADLTTELFSVHGNVSDMNVGPELSALAWARRGGRCLLHAEEKRGVRAWSML